MDKAQIKQLKENYEIQVSRENGLTSQSCEAD